METFKDIRVLLKGKNWKKLTAFSVFIFLLITVIVFFAVFKLCEDIQLKQMDEYLTEIPGIVDSRTNELLMRNQILEKDALFRAELGSKLYGEANELTDAEKLEQVRSAVFAESLTLLDEKGQLISTTGSVTPEENFLTLIKTLEPGEFHPELYPALTEEGKETGKIDGKTFLMISLPGNGKGGLVFEFSCDPILELYNTLSDWSLTFERVLSGTDAVAYAKTGDKIQGYPWTDLTSEQTSKLTENLTKIFQKNDSFRRSGNRTPNRIISLPNGRYLAAMMHYPQEDTDILLAVPLSDIIINGFFIATAISTIIGWGIVLIRIYILRILRRKEEAENAAPVSREQVYQATWPGIAVITAVTLIFSLMLLALENRTRTAYSAITRREAIEDEISWGKDQEKTIRRTYVDVYKTRAQIIANYLTEHPDHQTHEGLSELNHIAGTDYLMLFDSTGEELVSSNSYTGFSVGTNLSEAYRAVLMGYPDAVVGPEADPYTGRMQLGTAIMMPDRDGLPDGFFLAVYSAGDMKTELDRMSYENLVNSNTFQNGHIAAAINDEDGSFIAHTNPQMIGGNAVQYLEAYEPGKFFEGFTSYNGEDMYISASSANGKTLLFMIPERWNSYQEAESIPILLAVVVLLILILLYYPYAGILIMRALKEVKENLHSGADAGTPVKIFIDGYDVFLTLFALFTLIVSSTGKWTSFAYVLGGQWSKGVNLFSIWAALFTLTISLFCGLLIRTVLGLLESRLSLRGQTITRLINSLVSYGLGLFLFFYILDLFGVNTTAMLASAGIISIAVGMGAKSMAEDMLAGFFMMMEDSVHVGDLVSVGGTTGHVTDMGIRTTTITDTDGNVVILNNSRVTGVRNMSMKSVQQETEKKPEKGSKKSGL